MRQLKVSDVFKMSKILNKLDVQVDAADKSAEQMGVDMIKKAAENLYMAETEVTEFLSDLIGISVKEFSNLPYKEVKKYYEEFLKLDGIGDFFKQAGL